MSDPHVRRDPSLRAMLQQVVAEREAAFPRKHENLPTHAQGFVHASAPQPRPKRADPAAEARELTGVLERKYHEAAARFNEPEARAALEKLRLVWARNPELGGQDRLAHHEEELACLVERGERFRAHLEELASKAMHAAAQGEEPKVFAALKRLTSIHAMHPELLSDGRFEEIRNRIQTAGLTHADQLIAQKLLERERAVAREIKNLANAIHRFHRVARTVPHDDPAYDKAEADYQAAVRSLDAHDADWLAGVILELVDVLGEFHTLQRTPQHQVDRFVASVRSALVQLKSEIRQDK